MTHHEGHSHRVCVCTSVLLSRVYSHRPMQGLKKKVKNLVLTPPRLFFPKFIITCLYFRRANKEGDKSVAVIAVLTASGNEMAGCCSHYQNENQP